MIQRLGLGKIRTWIALIVPFILLGGFFAWFYVRAQHALEQNEREMLTVVAELEAADIDTAVIDSVAGPEDAARPEFIALVEKLKEIKDVHSNFKYVYIMRKTADPQYLEFVAEDDMLATTEELDANGNGMVDEDEVAVEIGELYDVSGTPTLQTDEPFERPTTDKEISVDQWGSWISGYAPIYRPDGSVAAILGIDVTADQFAEETLKIISPSLLIGILILLLLASFIYSVYSLYINHTLAVNIAQDLTKKYKEERAKAQAIVSGIGEGLFVCDAQKNIILFNDALAAMLGSQCTGVSLRDVSKTCNLLYKDEHAEYSFDTLYDETMRTGGIQDVHLVSVNKEKNTRRYIRITSHVMKTEDGAALGMVVVASDITKEQEIDRIKTDFIAIASHQLSTPPAIVNWQAEALLSERYGPLNGPQREHLEEISKSGRKMAELIADLLDTTRIDSGVLNVDRKQFDFVAFAEKLRDEYSLKISANKLTVVTAIDPALASIQADTKLTRLIFENLFSNAVKYTPSGGTITVRASLDKVNGMMHCSVADTGFGIPKESQAKIFTKLYRADNIRDKEADGTGLGLYIVKSVVNLLGGTISFESEENKGTTFYVTLPL